LGGIVKDDNGIKELTPYFYVSDEMVAKYRGIALAEQSLVLRTSLGLVLVVGCSHPGIVAMTKNIKAAYNEPVYGIIGGLHLMNSSRDEIRACAGVLKQEGIAFIVPTHCTGWRAERALRKVLGKGYLCLREGRSISL
jgi:7,8-dihydropterin-6-yl-methyl-4-(beta-D-ribofuranosyl)aminobenzene 5'-phosphate synthase